MALDPGDIILPKYCGCNPRETGFPWRDSTTELRLSASVASPVVVADILHNVLCSEDGDEVCVLIRRHI